MMVLRRSSSGKRSPRINRHRQGLLTWTAGLLLTWAVTLAALLSLSAAAAGWSSVVGLSWRSSPTSLPGGAQDPADVVNYLILFEEPPVAMRHVDYAYPRVSSVADIGRRTFLLARQQQAIAIIEQEIGRTIAVGHHYTVAADGISAWLTAEEARLVSKLPGVRMVQPDRMRQPLSDAGPAWIGAFDVWSGALGGLPATEGEGVIIGVIDTGINMDHPSFADVGDDGYDHVNPRGPGSFLGYCATNPAIFSCNDKLIGAWSWPEVGGDPEDDWGHGSSVASIAAGNHLTVTYIAPTIVLTPTLSGVAPHANLISYDVCGPPGSGCPDSVSIAAIDQAVADGVDVINFSIGGVAVDPWMDPLALAFLAARQAGIVVVTSAGNAGPGMGTILSPANAPWMMTVGTATHNARFVNSLLQLAGGSSSPPADMIGSSITSGYGPAPLVYAGNYTNTVAQDDGRCSISFPAGTWNGGEIVFCRRGGVSSGQKAANVLAGGAAAVVVGSNVTTYQSLGIDRLPLPGVNLLQPDGDALMSWLLSGSGHTATIGGTSRDLDAAFGDEMYFSSSRGPAPYGADVLKPEVIAPGTTIWGAYRDPGSGMAPPLAFYTGTSQASPHVAGASALLRVLHPSWTVAEIESALMTTAVTTTVHQAGSPLPAGPLDMGSGRVNLAAAALAGLVLNETTVGFLSADSALGGDPSQLNRASLSDANCVQVCRWSRVLRNTLPVTATWTAVTFSPISLTLSVSPTTLVMGPGLRYTVVVTADVSAMSMGTWEFGELRFFASGGLAPDAHLPLAVKAAAAKFPSLMRINTRVNAGSQLLPGLHASGITALTINTYGLIQGATSTRFLSQDSTRGDPFDNLNDGTTFFITVTVPAGSRRLVTELTASEAPDLELFVGLDAGDGIPQAGETVCTSATPRWEERCNLLDPPAGTYWILVQTWLGSGAPADELQLATAVVPNQSAGNGWVAGPLGMPVSGPFELRYYWDAPLMLAGDRWYGVLDVGTRPDSPGDLGMFPVDLIRHEDDLIYASSPSTATLGMAQTYTITLRPNVTPHDIAYTLTLTIPAGISYVADSVTGGAAVHGDQLTWEPVSAAFSQLPMIATYQAMATGMVCNQNVKSEVSIRSDLPGGTVTRLGLDTFIVCHQRFLPAIFRR